MLIIEKIDFKPIGDLFSFGNKSESPMRSIVGFLGLSKRMLKPLLLRLFSINEFKLKTDLLLSALSRKLEVWRVLV